MKKGKVLKLEENRKYWLCPLYNFQCFSNKVELTKGFRIIPSWKELRKYMMEYYVDWPKASSFKYIIIYPQVKNIPSLTEAEKNWLSLFYINHWLFWLISALRLCHSGVIIPGPLISAQLDITSTKAKYNLDVYGWSNIPTEFGYFEGEIAFEGVGLDFDTKTNTAFYKFHKKDVSMTNSIMNTFEMLFSTSDMNKLNEILKRFNSSYYGSLDDRLIDQMIAFESLFLGDPDELIYKLATRITFFLEKDECERIKIFNIIKKAYNFRSKIVHGSKKVNNKELKAILPLTEDYLRRSINRFLPLFTQGNTLDIMKNGKKDTLAKLDENILTNGKTLRVP